MRLLVSRSLAALAVGCLAAPAFAVDLFFTGTFTADNDLALFQFQVADPASVVVLQTGSYAVGGFDPLLTFATGSRLIAGENDDIRPDSRDSFLQFTLDPGTYFVALTQYENAARGPELLNGFVRDGDPNYTLQNAPAGATGNFYTFDGLQRTGDYSLSIRGVASGSQTSLAALAPEPASLGFVAAVLPVALVAVRRRRAR